MRKLTHLRRRGPKPDSPARNSAPRRHPHSQPLRAAPWNVRGSLAAAEDHIRRFFGAALSVRAAAAPRVSDSTPCGAARLSYGVRGCLCPRAGGACLPVTCGHGAGGHVRCCALYRAARRGACQGETGVDSAGKRTLSRAHKRAALREIACVVVPAPATSARSGGRSAEQQPDALGVVDALVGAGFDIVQLRQARRAVAAHDGWAQSEMAVKPVGRPGGCVRACVLAAAGPVWRR